jgi:hypothetical protein
VKKAAAESGRTITALIEDALRESLLRRRQPHKSVRLPIYRPKRPGLQPGVDVNDSAALLDLMDTAGDSRRR